MWSEAARCSHLAVLVSITLSSGGPVVQARTPVREVVQSRTG
ncbi:hypothetical protein V2I01_19035 [Micromonospora sp. BRA006-A]|nr:hypothetical protein [Micromonospora sp. BRA006-A]